MRRFILGLALLLAACGAACADTYPSKPIAGRVEYYFCPIATALPMTPSEFDAYVKGELARYATFAKAAGLMPN